MNQKALSIAPTQQGERRWRGAIDMHAVHLRRGASHGARGLNSFTLIFGRDNDCRKASERRRTSGFALLGLGIIKCITVTSDQGRNDRMIGIARLDEHLSGFFSAPCPACSLRRQGFDAWQARVPSP
jgi:hypothetical protein